METEARYTLIGIFTLAVTLAAFAFVYWLNTVGGLSQRTRYMVRYENTVSGLTRGSAVLFNGIRVGEVAELRLSADQPRLVTALISVDKSTPVRADTRASIDFQGLMGAPAVSLNGGTSNAALPVSAQGEVPLLVADQLAGQNMSQAARDALRHVDALVTDNADPVKSIVANLNTFSAALARNADRIDGVLAGLEKFGGGGAKTQPRIFDLYPPSDFAKGLKVPAGQIVVADPTSLAVYDTDKLLVRSPDGDRPALANTQWPDMLPKLVQARIIQGFEAAGYMRALARAPEGMGPATTILLDVRAFHVMPEPTPLAVVEIAAKLIGPDGKVVGARTFKAEAPVSLPAAGIEAAGAVAALRIAFADAAKGLVGWTCVTLP